MPWHPVLVHYPIALTILAAALQLWAVLERKNSFFLPALVLAGILVLVTGHFGGRLVYTYGAGVSSPVPGELGPVR